MSDITIFRAKKILTMNPRRPIAAHVAVRDGHILGAGALEELSAWGAYELDGIWWRRKSSISHSSVDLSSPHPSSKISRKRWRVRSRQRRSRHPNEDDASPLR